MKSQLHGGNMNKGINSWAVSVIRYTAGIIGWSKKELKANFFLIQAVKFRARQALFQYF